VTVKQLFAMSCEGGRQFRQLLRLGDVILGRAIFHFPRRPLRGGPRRPAGRVGAEEVVTSRAASGNGGRRNITSKTENIVVFLTIASARHLTAMAVKSRPAISVRAAQANTSGNHACARS